MHQRILWRTLLPASLALLALAAWLGAAREPAAAAAATVNRPSEPVVIAGADAATLLSAPIDELALYAYDGSAWTPIPFQIDEVTSTGQYTTTGSDDDDGGLALFDANDELVFMADDAGVAAPDAATWVGDPYSELNDRVRIQIDDPLTAEQAVAYLYRSPTLARSDTVYISWQPEVEIIEAVSYTADFNSTLQFGVADLFLNGTGVDILDKQTVLVDGTVLVPLIGCTFPLPIPFTLTEADLALDAPLDPAITGPVRVVSGAQGFAIASYGGRFDVTALFDLAELIGDFGEICGLELDVLRQAFDWNEPGVTGLDRYYNSNGVTAVIDGAPDSVPVTPTADWYELAASQASNVGGLVVALQQFSVIGSTGNYYQDNAAQGRYGEFGVQAVNVTEGVIDIRLVTYVLPQNSPGSQGATYSALASNPVSVSTLAESHPTGANGPFVYLSVDSAGSVAGVSFDSADILVHNHGSGSWGIYFDASDVGLDGANVGGVAVLPNGLLLLSFTGPTTVPGLVPPGMNPVQCADVVAATVTSFGPDTTATFRFGFDGSDVGLDSECLDGFTVGDGLVPLVTVNDAFAAQTVTGGDADLFRLTSPTYGPVTSGTWSFFIDGAVGGFADFGSEDIDALHLDAATTTYYLSTLGAFSGGGTSGGGEDVVRCTGSGCTLYVDGSAYGLTGSIDGLHIDFTPGVIVPLPPELEALFDW